MKKTLLLISLSSIFCFILAGCASTDRKVASKDMQEKLEKMEALKRYYQIKYPPEE